MKLIRICTVVLSRFCLSAIFLASSVNKILHWHETEKTLMNVLCDWQIYADFSENVQMCMSAVTPWTPLLLIIATLFELVGGLLLLLGVREKLGAALLILFLIPTTVLIHPFWFAEGSGRELQTAMFLKNLAIFGGLLMVLLHGAQTKESEDSYSSMNMG